MAQLDPLIHAPARLQVVTTLSAVSEAEFATLRAALQVSDSVLSKHISALADHNLRRPYGKIHWNRVGLFRGIAEDVEPETLRGTLKYRCLYVHIIERRHIGIRIRFVDHADWRHILFLLVPWNRTLRVR